MLDSKIEEHLKKNPDYENRSRGNTHAVMKLDQYQHRLKKRFLAEERPRDIITELPEKVAVNPLLDIAESIDYFDYSSLKCGIIGSEIVESIFSKYMEDVYSVMFTRLLPGEDILPHADPVRGSIIYVPLCRSENTYAPLEIYQKDKIIAIGKKDIGSSFVWNTKIQHAVFNREAKAPRYNLQLNCNLTYDEFLKKYVP